MPRLYIDVPIIPNQSFILKDAPFNHAIRVLRLQIKDEIVLFNGTGGEYLAIITSIDKKQAVLQVLDFNPIERESSLNLHLYQALAKGDKLDYILQKATELGVSSITLLISKRSIAAIAEERLDKKMAHFRSIIISACEQCGRNTLPVLELPLKLHKLNLSSELNYLTLDPKAEDKLSDSIKVSTKGATHKNIALIIGPEGGLSPDELDLLSKKGCQSINLGARILRTETAAIAVIAALQALFGDW